jgi:aspartate aminotransferase
MTGWRIGYMGANKEIAFACEKIQSQYTSGTSSISQRAALAALTGTMQPTLDMATAYKRRRDLVLHLMKDIAGFKTNKPEGAFYVFADVSFYFGKSDGATTIHSSEELCMYLLEKAHVALVSGDAFGAPDCVRFAYATSDEKLTEALKRIKKTVDKLK